MIFVQVSLLNLLFRRYFTYNPGDDYYMSMSITWLPSSRGSNISFEFLLLMLWKIDQGRTLDDRKMCIVGGSEHDQVFVVNLLANKDKK